MSTVVEPDMVVADLRRHEPNFAETLRASPRLDRLGAGNYYMARLENKILLPQAEWDVLQYIFRNYPIASTIVEIGCGWGQLLAMASAVGYRGIGVDVAAGRIEGAKALREVVDGDFAGTAGRLDYFEAVFPENWQGVLDRLSEVKRGPVIGFFSNLGYGATEEYCDNCLAEFGHFNFVIMDIVRFFANRGDLEVQNAFIEKMKDLGIEYVADIFHLPGAYRFIALSVDSARVLAARARAERAREEAAAKTDHVFAWIEAVKAAGGTVSPERAILVDRLIMALKQCGAWGRLDRLWIFAGENQAQALTDLVACGQATTVGEPSFAANLGYVFDGRTQYIDTGFSAAVRAAKYSLVSASFGGFIFGAADRAGGVEFGNDFGAYSMLMANYGNRRRFQINSASDSSNYPTNDVFTGHFHGQRGAADATELFLNGISQGTTVDAARGVPTNTFFVGAGRGSNGPTNHSNASISTAHVGCSFQSGDEVAKFDEVIRSYLGCLAP